MRLKLSTVATDKPLINKQARLGNCESRAPAYKLQASSYVSREATAWLFDLYLDDFDRAPAYLACLNNNLLKSINSPRRILLEYEDGSSVTA